MFHSDIETHGVVSHPVEHLPRMISTSRACGDGGTNIVPEPDVLHVVIPYSNYSSFKSRTRLNRLCIAELEKLEGVKIWIVEVALGDKPFVVTERCNPQHVQLRTKDMIWHKESMINVCIRHMSLAFPNWKYVAWVDGDIRFMNKNVAFKTIDQLQSYSVVQMFSSVVNLGPEGQIHDTHNGFCYQYAKNGYKDRSPGSKDYAVWHPGFAWACTRDAYKSMGGLIDWAILGSADHHMAKCLIGSGETSVNGKCSEAYKRKIRHVQERYERSIKRNIGYVPGTIEHGWHGAFKLRKYVDRWQILIECDYDPDADVKYDDQGLLMLDTEKFRLRDLIRHYFDQRNEDSIETS